MKTPLILICFLTIQNLFSQVVISKDTTISGKWEMDSKTYEIAPGVKIHGKGSINGGYIKAGRYQDIFDTSLSIRPKGTYDGIFSVAWFGAKSSNQDNYWNIQKSINTCISSAIRQCFIPSGNYNYSQSLEISNVYKGLYVGATLRLYGESSFWDSGVGSTLNLTKSTGSALNLQHNKGSEVDHLVFKGQWKSPTTADSIYYNTSLNDYKDISGKKCDDYYYGIVIDGKQNQNGGINGSTGLKVHDVYVTGFTRLVVISPNGKTLNAEILLFKDIKLGEGKVGIETGEAQEKANRIEGVYAWNRLHTLFSSGNWGRFEAGNWTIDGANIANKVIRLFDIKSSGWYTTNISNVFAESIGSIGTITSGNATFGPLPVGISNSTFHFADLKYAGRQTLFYSNNTKIKFLNCIFRYYGSKHEMKFAGEATYDNCMFSGPFTNPAANKNKFINSHTAGKVIGN